MPSTVKEKNAQSYNTIKNGLYNLNKFISANGSDDLFTLFTENKKTEIDDLFFIPPRQSNPHAGQKGKLIDLLTRTNGWFTPENKGDTKNVIREKVFGIFSFKPNEQRDLRIKLTNLKKNNEQTIIAQIEAFEEKIDKLTPDESFIYINLYISVRWDNIISLERFGEIKKSLNAKNFISLSPEYYKLLKSKKAEEDLASPDTNHDLNFSNLGRIKEWSAVKKEILDDLIPPQIDSLSPDSTSSSASHAKLHSVASIKDVENSAENHSVSMKNLGPTTTSEQITTEIPNELEQKNQEIAQLQNTKKELEEKCQSMEGTKAKIETQISELKILLQTNEAALQQESESNKQKLESLQTTLAFFQEITKDKEVELEALKKLKEDYLLSLQSAKSDLQKTKNETNDLTTKLKETEVKIKTLEANNIKLAAEIEKTTTKLIETTDTLALRSSDHVAISKQLNDLQIQHSDLQNFLENQKRLLQEDLQTKEVDNNLLHIEISKLKDEIGLTKNKLSDTEIKLKDANQKYDASKKAIDILQLNKIELEEQNKGLITQKNEIQTHLSKQKDTHQALVRNHELLIAESTKKDRALEKQKNVIIKVEGQLKNQIEQFDQLKEEIKEKDIQIEKQRQKVSKINETLQEKEKEFQQIAGQLDTIKHQLREANEGEKTAREKLAANESKMQELEPLKEQISQAKESYKQLSIKLHSKENKAEQLNQDLNVLNEQTASFVQAVQNELNRLNPKEPQTSQELDSIDTKYRINPIDSTIPLDEDVTGTSSNSDRVTEKLDHLKRQLISTFYNLKSQNAQKKRLFETKQREIDTLRNQYKDLEITGSKLNSETIKKLIKEKEVLEEQISSLTNQLEDHNKKLYQATTPAKYRLEDDWDSDLVETADDHDLTAAYLEELESIRASLKETKTELEQKNNELTELQKQLDIQVEQSNSKQVEFEREVDALKKSFDKAVESISVLEAEKLKLDTNLKNVQEVLEKYKNEITRLKSEHAAELTENDSINKDKISRFIDKNSLLEEKIKGQENSINDLESEIAEKDKEIKDLKQQTLQATHAKDLEKLENNLQASESHIVRLQTELKKKANNINQLQKDKQQHEKRVISLSEEQKTLSEELIETEENLKKIKGDFELANEKLRESQNSANKLSDDNNILIKKIETLQKTHSELQIKYGTLEKGLKDKNEKITEIETQIENGKQKVEVLAIGLEKAEENTQSLKKQIRELTDKDKNMPNKHVPLNKMPSDLNLDTLKTNSRDSLSFASPSSPANSSTTSSRSLENVSDQNSASNSSGFDDGKASSTDSSSSRISYHLSRRKSESDLRRNIVNNPNATHVRRNSTSADLTDLSNEGIQIEDIFSNGEFHEQLKIALTNKFDNDYKETFDDPANSLDNSILTEALLNLDSEESKREALVNQTYDGLLAHSEDLKNILLSLSNNAILEPLTLKTLAEQLVETLANTLNPPVNPFENKYCATLLQEALAENQTNTKKLINHAKGVINTFKEENHEEINQAFTAEFVRIASTAANILFNENIVDNPDLPTFKDELNKKANEEAKDLISALSKSNEKILLLGTIKKIHIDGLNYATYLEEVKNSASFIFETLRVGQKNYKDHIADIGKDLLKNLCIENLQTEEKANLIETAEKTLATKVTDANLEPTEHAETIKTAAEELVTKLLETNSIKDLIDQVSNNLIVGTNLLEASKQKLQEQLDQQINQSFRHYFPNIHLDPILEKISKNNALLANDPQKLLIEDVLTEDEKLMFPPELQYAETIKEFISGLRVQYPHLPFNYEIDENSFNGLRLMLRKKALSAINQSIPEGNDIIDLNAETWLEKKLQLITDKSVSLELIKLGKEQANLLNELSSSLQVSTFYDIAITRKTIPELTQEIEKANKAQSSAAEQISQIFKEIESKQTAYPKLIDDEAIAGFSANLNQHLENSSIALDVNNEQAKILLMGINQRLKKDINKWEFFDNITLQREITNDILANPNGFTFDETDTEKLIHHALLVLRNNYPNDTVKKREQWLKDITLLHIATRQLLAFSQKIEINKAKFLDLKELKEQNPASQALNEKIDDVYLPKSCSIVANSLDSSFAARQSVEHESFKIDTIFYKQNALKINQTLTFSQALPNKKEQNWSVFRIDDTRLVYQTHKSWLDVIKSVIPSTDNLMYVRSNNDKQFNAEEEVLFTQLTHAVNSSKSKICKITISKNCPKRKEKFIRCFIDNHNKNKSEAEPILECPDNDTLKMHKEDKVHMENTIRTASNLHAKELENANKQSNELVNRHIRPRG